MFGNEDGKDAEIARLRAQLDQAEAVVLAVEAALDQESSLVTRKVALLREALAAYWQS